MRAWIGSASALLLLASAATGQTILVYDSGNHLQCWGAAQAKYPGSSTLATNADFTTKLQSGVYDVVVASAPSGLLPSGAWPALSNFVGGGGRAALSFWDWDNDAGYGDPLLLTAFEVTAASSISLGTGTVLQDAGTSTLFQGVTLPNADWHNHWNDDGDTFTVTGGGVGLAHFGDPTRPAVVLGNQGRTLAMPCWDEAGDTWLNDGSGALLWENVFDLMALGGCTPTASSATVRLGFPANPDVLHPVAPGGPVLGSEFQVVVDHSLWMPTAILDVASVCVFQMNLSTSAGTLLVDLSTQVVSTFVNAGQPIAFPVPVDCALVGLPASIQVGSVAVGDLQLTNALDLVIGNQ